MKSAGSWAEAVPLSSDDSDSESKIEGVGSTGRSNKSLVVKSAQDVNPEGICFPDDEVGTIESTNKIVVVHLVKDVMSEVQDGINMLNGADAVIKRAEIYQEYMKQLPIPTNRGSVIPFTTWQGLAKSLKILYGQPLHYLTNILLKQWDVSRIGTDDEHLPLDTIIHPCKAEATIWLMEEVHRLTSSHHHLGELWASDPMHHAFVDPVRKKK